MIFAQADTTVNTGATAGGAIVGLIFGLVYLAYVVWLLFCVFRVAKAGGYNPIIALVIMFVFSPVNLYILAKLYGRVGESGWKWLMQLVPILGPIELTRLAKKLQATPNLAFAQG